MFDCLRGDQVDHSVEQDAGVDSTGTGFDECVLNASVRGVRRDVVEVIILNLLVCFHDEVLGVTSRSGGNESVLLVGGNLLFGVTVVVVGSKIACSVQVDTHSVGTSSIFQH